MSLKRDKWVRPNSDTLRWIVQRETSNIREMSSQVKPRERSSTNVSSFMSNFGLPTCLVSTLFGEFSEKTATCEHLVRLGNSHLRWQSQNINWKFLAISRTASLLVCDTNWDTFCKARTAFSKRNGIVKFSVIAMSFVDRCCSYSLNNSSKSVKNKLHWLFISFWSSCVTSRSLPSAILLSDKFSSPQTLSVETGQLGPNFESLILTGFR